MHIKESIPVTITHVKEHAHKRKYTSNNYCDVPREDAFHFFFECRKYTDIRRDLLICVNRFRMTIDLALLTTGNQNLTYEDNCLIFKEDLTSVDHT
jgi:hypothetical protein